MFVRRAAVATLRATRAAPVRTYAMPASAFSGENDPKYKEFQATCAIENLYEFNVHNVTQFNIELRKLADLKVHDKLKSTYDVMKSKRIIPDSSTIEIVMRSAEPNNFKRVVTIFDDVLTYQLDPTAETYKTMATIFKASGNTKCADLCAAMAKDEDRYGSDRMVELVNEFHAIAAKQK
eukprot:Sspe_Gene.21048::Locus_7822_Transcript_1_1_Confidence_1.000_Length_651::g.21048::m.21048